MSKVFIAFSGGLESTYLAQMMLEKGHRVELVYTNAYGVQPCFLEASLVFRCYKKLKELFPDNNLQFYYMDREFFGTHHSFDNRVLHTNQAMRIACLMAELQKLEGVNLYMCGWTGEGTLETSLNPGAYSTKQYEDMKLLPITLNQYTRLAVKPSPILTPLWGMTKKEVFCKLHSELHDVIVLNTANNKISDVKIDEWKEAELPVPDYVNKFMLGNITWKDLINNFGLYFATPYIWEQWINHLTGLTPTAEKLSLLSYASPRIGHGNRALISLNEINSNVRNFEEKFIKYFKSQEQEKSNVN